MFKLRIGIKSIVIIILIVKTKNKNKRLENPKLSQRLQWRLLNNQFNLWNNINKSKRSTSNLKLIK
jgi:sensor domain CHASE-containing protein